MRYNYCFIQGFSQTIFFICYISPNVTSAKVHEYGVYVLRQMVEKRLEVQGSMALGFVDWEKAFDTVPGDMMMATLR